MVSMCKYAVDWYSKVDDALILGKTHFFVSTSVLSDWLVGDLKLCQSTYVYPEKKTSTPDNLARNIVSLSSHHKYLLRLPTDNPLVFILHHYQTVVSVSHSYFWSVAHEQGSLNSVHVLDSVATFTFLSGYWEQTDKSSVGFSFISLLLVTWSFVKAVLLCPYHEG